MNVYYVTAIWLGMALVAAVVSIRVAVPAALVEIVVGSLALTFPAGAEIDPASLREHWRASVSLGLVSFALPVPGGLRRCCPGCCAWRCSASRPADLRAGDQAAPCRAVRARRPGHPGGRPRRCCPPTSPGWSCATGIPADRVLMDRLRSMAFALLTTPFFFLQKAGTLIAAPALVGGAGVIALLLPVKLAAKLTGVWPVAATFRLPRREDARLHHPADGHRADLRLHLGAVRPHRPPTT